MRRDRQQRRENVGKADIKVAEAGKSSRKVIQANNIGFEYDGKFLFKDFSTEFKRVIRLQLLVKMGVVKQHC